jgi:hypothetical protein
LGRTATGRARQCRYSRDSPVIPIEYGLDVSGLAKIEAWLERGSALNTVADGRDPAAAH